MITKVELNQPVSRPLGATSYVLHVTITRYWKFREQSTLTVWDTGAGMHVGGKFLIPPRRIVAWAWRQIARENPKPYNGNSNFAPRGVV